MKQNYWKFATLYLLIGVLWASVCVYQGAKKGHYASDYSKASVTLLVNVAIWPISVPLGIYVLVLKQ